jgi:hypothetical protein
MAEDKRDREEGVDFTEINGALDDIDYPITTAEFVDEYGSHTIERTNADSIPVRGLFDGTGPDTFESPDDVQQSLLNLMPGESVGRQRYSDRGGATPGDGSEQEDDTL